MDGVDLVEIAIVEEIDEETEEVADVYANSYCAHYGEVKKISQIRFRPQQGLPMMNQNGEVWKVFIKGLQFPSPTGVTYDESVYDSFYVEFSGKDGFRPQQWLPMMNRRHLKLGDK